MKSIHFRKNALVAKQALDRLDTLLDYKPLEYATKPIDIEEYSLEFKNVVFSYEGQDKKAIDNISFTVKEGETVALVGESGGGKTTIARLAARFWEVDEGEILIGGINIKDIPKGDLMDYVSFVFQSTKLFKGTIKDNVLYGNQEALDGEIVEALNKTQCKDILDNLPDRLGTVIGSKGTYLSGGEQQRIALARAMVKNAPIVLLDEATAFTDPENEHLIQKGLKELGKNKTTLIIAHRLTSVKDADKILVIDKGKIVEVGTHKELLKMDGKYKDMWCEYQQSISWSIDNKAIEYQGGLYA